MWVRHCKICITVIDNFNLPEIDKNIHLQSCFRPFSAHVFLPIYFALPTYGKLISE